MAMMSPMSPWHEVVGRDVPMAAMSPMSPWHEVIGPNAPMGCSSAHTIPMAAMSPCRGSPGHDVPPVPPLMSPRRPQGGGSEQERTKKKRRGDRYSIHTSLIVATLKKMLPIGLNMCSPTDQELISLAKSRYALVGTRWGRGGGAVGASLRWGGP